MSFLRPNRPGPESLLVRVRADPDAFADFYDEYVDRVVVYFTRRVLDVDVALDLTAEAFAVALERHRQFRGHTPEEEQGWLFSICRTQLSRYWRRGAVERRAVERMKVDVPEATDADVRWIDERAGLETLRHDLERAMARLPVDQKRAIQLRVLDELPYGDIAEDMNVSEELVRARVSRGLKTLSRHLVRYRPELEDAA